ncbi:MAG: hypothetical protein KDI98_09395, partial [Hyphomicrobiaceae bacterium]|nr:hypothetical protein [Hyphomicrobiaceae bacterium]
LASGYAVAMNGIDSVSWGLFRCLLSFFIGVLIHEIDTDRSVTVSPWLAVFLIGATIFDIGLAEGMTRPMLLVFPLLFAAVIVALNHTPQDSRVIRVLSHPWLVYLGTISFGIYMIHSAFWWVARQSLRFIFHVETEVTPAGITEIVLGNTMLASAIHVAGIAALLLAAHLSYRYFEKPIMNRFR